MANTRDKGRRVQIAPGGFLSSAGVSPLLQSLGNGFVPGACVRR